mmetsp:Transcript_107359/g.309045  ORF Transcript_107359/g.309045 Transcript_107359/m.309045 type:complete len:343 (+) Transcript_107359:758-1786(+)
MAFRALNRLAGVQHLRILVGFLLGRRRAPGVQDQEVVPPRWRRRPIGDHSADPDVERVGAGHRCRGAANLALAGPCAAAPGGREALRRHGRDVRGQKRGPVEVVVQEFLPGGRGHQVPEARHGQAVGHCDVFGMLASDERLPRAHRLVHMVRVESQILGLRGRVFLRHLLRLAVGADVCPVQEAGDLPADVHRLVATNPENDDAVRLRRELPRAWFDLQAAGLEQVPWVPPEAQHVLGGVVHKNQNPGGPGSHRATIEVQDLDRQRRPAAGDRRVGLDGQVLRKHRVGTRHLAIRVVTVRVKLEDQFLGRAAVFEHLDAHGADVALRLQGREGEVQERRALR